MRVMLSHVFIRMTACVLRSRWHHAEVSEGQLAERLSSRVFSASPRDRLGRTHSGVFSQDMPPVDLRDRHEIFTSCGECGPGTARLATDYTYAASRNVLLSSSSKILRPDETLVRHEHCTADQYGPASTSSRPPTELDELLAKLSSGEGAKLADSHDHLAEERLRQQANRAIAEHERETAVEQQKQAEQKLLRDQYDLIEYRIQQQVDARLLQGQQQLERDRQELAAERQAFMAEQHAFHMEMKRQRQEFAEVIATKNDALAATLKQIEVE